jgi:hypothetical protein
MGQKVSKPLARAHWAKEASRLGNCGAGLADDDAELALEHHLAFAQRLADGLAGGEEGVGRLQQVQRLGRHRQLELLAERVEVVPQRDDLGGLGGRERLELVQREHAAGRLRRGEHVAAVLAHMLAVQRAEARLAGAFEADPSLRLLHVFSRKGGSRE